MVSNRHITEQQTNDMSKYLAYCGSRCDACPRYKATLSNDLPRLIELAELWHRCGWRDEILPPESMRCSGCHSGMWCRYEIPACALAHNAPHCGECKEYRKCPRLQDMLVRNAAYKMHCESVCSPEELGMLKATCFDKKANLEARSTRLDD